MATVSELTKQLKDNMEALERLRIRRKELKSALGKDGLSETDEAALAKELASVSNAIITLETDRLVIYAALQPAVK